MPTLCADDERETHPVAIGVVSFGESCDGLLAAARAVGHVVRVQPVLRLLVHQLDHAPVRHLQTPAQIQITIAPKPIRKKTNLSGRS